MYYTINNEHFQGCKQTIREFIVAYKGCPITGDLIYGASISRRGYGGSCGIGYLDEKEVVEHFKTAQSRLEKCPVQMNIVEEYRHQLNNDSDSTHDEDVMYSIMDKIYSRVSGYFQIRGDRL